MNDMADHSVAESGVQLLTAQKPGKRSGWWKGKFALCWMPTTESQGEGRHLSQG